MRALRAAALGIVLGNASCTGESTRFAIEAQRRADTVQQTVFERQHEGLCGLLFRQTVQQLEAGAQPLSEAQRTALNAAWSERDLVEFWALQNERGRALRLIAVDGKLFGEQSIVDLLVKQIDAKAKRAEEAIAALPARE